MKKIKLVFVSVLFLLCFLPTTTKAKTNNLTKSTATMFVLSKITFKDKKPKYLFNKIIVVCLVLKKGVGISIGQKLIHKHLSTASKFLLKGVNSKYVITHRVMVVWKKHMMKHLATINGHVVFRVVKKRGISL